MSKNYVRILIVKHHFNLLQYKIKSIMSETKLARSMGLVLDRKTIKSFNFQISKYYNYLNHCQKLKPFNLLMMDQNINKQELKI